MISIRRIFAFALDFSLITALTYMTLRYLVENHLYTHDSIFLVVYGLFFLYEGTFHQFKGWTPGKRALGVVVKDKSGAGLEGAQAWNRGLAKTMLMYGFHWIHGISLELAIGALGVYAFEGFLHRDKQMGHDRFVGSMVRREG